MIFFIIKKKVVVLLKFRTFIFNELKKKNNQQSSSRKKNCSKSDRNWLKTAIKRIHAIFFKLLSLLNNYCGKFSVQKSRENNQNFEKKMLWKLILLICLIFMNSCTGKQVRFLNIQVKHHPPTTIFVSKIFCFFFSIKLNMIHVTWIVQYFFRRSVSTIFLMLKICSINLGIKNFKRKKL